MLSNWPIRMKLLLGLGVLVLVVGLLAGTGLYTTYAYRDLVNSLSWRVSELPLAAELSQHVGDLRDHARRTARPAHDVSAAARTAMIPSVVERGRRGFGSSATSSASNWTKSTDARRYRAAVGSTSCRPIRRLPTTSRSARRSTRSRRRWPRIREASDEQTGCSTT